jgi:hypothetical protein
MSAIRRKADDRAFRLIISKGYCASPFRKVAHYALKDRCIGFFNSIGQRPVPAAKVERPLWVSKAVPCSDDYGIQTYPRRSTCSSPRVAVRSVTGAQLRLSKCRFLEQG